LQRGGSFLPPTTGEQAGGLLEAGVASQVRVDELVGRDLVPQGGVGRAGDAAELGTDERFKKMTCIGSAGRSGAEPEALLPCAGETSSAQTRHD